MQRQRLALLLGMVNCEDCKHRGHPAEGLPEDKADMHVDKQGSKNPREIIIAVMTEGI